MNVMNNVTMRLNRRTFLSESACGLVTLGLASLLGQNGWAEGDSLSGIPDLPHFASKAKRVIYLFQSGAPSQIETFDHKPVLTQRQGQELPDSVRRGQRLTGMTAGQTSFPMVGSKFPFSRHGQSGTWLSSLLPHTAKIADDLCIIHSMHTEAINHDPAATLIQTG